ncbi:MAG: hypothetical protein V1928_04545 [Parcubacteria group bacterium]
MTITISLRKLGKKSCRILLCVERKVDEDNVPDDITEEDEAPGAFKEFIRKAKKLLPIKAKNVDVYIGLWGDDNFKIPLEFFKLIVKTKWPVEIDISD